jgi:hypothetical protein
VTDNSLPDRYDLTKDQDRDDRRKHLELVSAVVGRMAAASAAAKGWSITLAGAAFGVAVVRDKWYLILLGIVALLVFGIVDGLYLYNEKRFRALYAAIADQNAVRPLSMDLTVLEARKKKESFFSWSVVFFYGPLIVGGLVILAIALCKGGSEADEKSPSPTTTVTTSTVTVTETTTQTTAISPPEPSPRATTQSPPPPPSPTSTP